MKSHSASRCLGVFTMALVFAVGTGSTKAQGGVYTWGYNGSGQLGNGKTIDGNLPVQVSTLTGGVTAVAAGSYFSFAVKGGALYAWGANDLGELGNGKTTGSTTPVSVGTLTSGVTAVAAGQYYSLAIQNGAAYAWGYNNHGQLGNGTTDNSATPAVVSNLTSGVTSIAGGGSHGLAIQNGAAYAWGYNGYGQIGIGSSETNAPTPVAVSGLGSGVTAVAGGGAHSLALKDGTVYAWGYNSSGEVGVGTTDDVWIPIALGFSSAVTSIAAGAFHSLAVQNGGVYAWGDNQHGQLGNGTTSNSTTPVQIDAADLRNIVAVAGGEFSSYALAGDGSLWVWGDNNDGELGLGTTTSGYLIPQHLLPPTGYAYTALDSDCYGLHVVAILAPVLPKISGLSRPASGHFVLQASAGAPKVTYTIQAASALGLNSFSAIGTATTNAAGTLQYDDAGAVGATQRFYRVTYP